MNGIILIGPPACGKSTIGKHIAESFNMVYVSSGDIARKMAKTCTETSESLKVGGMAEETQMRDNIYRTLYDINVHNKVFVLDGFPRNEDQLIWLHQKFPALLFYLIETPICTCRARAEIRNRNDDSIYENRLAYYREHTYPMIDTISMNSGICAVRNIKLQSAIKDIEADVKEGLKRYDR